MDHIAALRALGLATRIRRVLELLLRDGKNVYQAAGVDFEVRWFAVFHLVTEASSLSITEIAERLGQRHPTVIQVVEEMTQGGLLRSTRDSVDGRRRRIELTPKGRNMARRLKPIWRAFEDAGRELVTEGGNDFLASLEKIESAIARRSMFERINAKLSRDTGEDSNGQHRRSSQDSDLGNS
jgi:DNA-binding MarR family transcriptional regulator